MLSEGRRLDALSCSERQLTFPTMTTTSLITYSSDNAMFPLLSAGLQRAPLLPLG